MTIITEEEFSYRHGRVPTFQLLRKQAECALIHEELQTRMDEEKKRLIKTGVTYNEFKDLVSTVHLKPISRRNRN